MKLFVWDFHGTLEKDNENAVMEISYLYAHPNRPFAKGAKADHKIQDLREVLKEI